ncbi:protein phosphatase 1 regulatory subunit 12A-like [Lytechinus pictus]|uniref:protein phosphatase 1 regulatory subunit 12A-like n=1 Tax=Lytechinus pictus TaxID=7653 RepID=UPI00240E90B3|nr:protein phosphatase 1 regulatory subunit 12A-like [Lytechinus pictus]
MKSGSESDDGVLDGPTSYRSRRRITFPAQVSFQCAVQQQDNAELVRLLDQHGARLDVNATNHSGMSLLQQATANRNLDTVKIMLCSDADVTLQDINGNTALHSAAAAGFRQAASLLIIFGADMFQFNHDGDMPVELAKDNATIDMLSTEMRRHIQDKVFLDKYGFIFRGIVLWERFLDWTKEFISRGASVLWRAAVAQYVSLTKETSKSIQSIEHVEIPKNTQDRNKNEVFNDDKESLKCPMDCGKDDQCITTQDSVENNTDKQQENTALTECNLSSVSHSS